MDESVGWKEKCERGGGKMELSGEEVEEWRGGIRSGKVDGEVFIK